MNVSMTEVFLLIWAIAATAGAFHFRHKSEAMTYVLYKLSTDLSVRKDFFEKHDAVFGEFMK